MTAQWDFKVGKAGMAMRAWAAMTVFAASSALNGASDCAQQIGPAARTRLTVPAFPSDSAPKAPTSIEMRRNAPCSPNAKQGVFA